MSNYGIDYTKDSGTGLSFGLNQKVQLKEFKFNPNGGKDGAAQDCIDIIFSVNGRDVSYRQFPIVTVFDGDSKITDPNHPKFKEAVQDFNRRMTQLVLCYVSEKELTAIFEANEPATFKAYADTLAEAIGEDFDKVELDLFGQYQWAIKANQTATFVELPKKGKYGAFVCNHVPAISGDWRRSADSSGIKFVDGEGNTHPFTRNKWFADSNFAKQQNIDKEGTNDDYEF